MSKKIAYIHGRPSGHPIHDAYAKSISADFIPVDFLMEWHANKSQNKFKRFLSWILCALFFPHRKKYDVFFCEGVREPLLFMNWFKLIKPPKQTIALMANETLYFLSVKKYGILAEFIMTSFLKKCDSLICIGKYQADLASKLLPYAKIYTIFNGIPSTRMTLLQNINPDLKSNKILVIANCASITRMHYKGLDLAVETFNLISCKFNEIELHIVGECSKEVIKHCEKLIDKEYLHRLFFHGQDKIEKHLSKSCLLLQLGRGDSFPTTSLESAAVGVPVFVTEETGTKEVLEKIDSFFITNLQPKDISKKIQEYLNIPLEQKYILSAKFKKAVFEYTADNANVFFGNVFSKIIKD